MLIFGVLSFFLHSERNLTVSMGTKRSPNPSNSPPDHLSTCLIVNNLHFCHIDYQGLINGNNKFFLRILQTLRTATNC